MTGIITRISHPRPRTRPCLMISSFSGLDGPLAFEPQATVRPYACLERLTVPVRPYVVSFFLTTESGSRGSPCDPPAIKNMHEHTSCEATRNKCIATSNKCLASSNKKLVETSATLLGTSDKLRDFMSPSLCVHDFKTARGITASSPQLCVGQKVCVHEDTRIRQGDCFSRWPLALDPRSDTAIYIIYMLYNYIQEKTVATWSSLESGGVPWLLPV